MLRNEQKMQIYFYISWINSAPEGLMDIALRIGAIDISAAYRSQWIFELSVANDLGSV